MILTDVWGLYKADKQIQGYSQQTLKAIMSNLTCW